QDGILAPERRAAVDDFLRAALDLRVATLHRGEIEVGTRGTAAHRRSRAAAEADEHGRPAQHHDLRAHRDVAFLNVVAAHVAEATGDHDGLVVAARAVRLVTRRRLLEGAEIAGD